MTHKYVFSYINPDTDGVCCSLAYAELVERTRGECFVPTVWGRINAETELVLSRFGVESPLILEELTGDYRVALVDTHHPEQLPFFLDLSRVVDIIDHHPAGRPEVFVHARIQNEEVGAAATLISERFLEAEIMPSPQAAGLLAAAIISNTLDLKTPSTSPRDRKMLEILQSVAKIPDSFVSRMFMAVSDTAGLTTAEILTTHYKEFRADGMFLGIVQIETTDPSFVTGRDDLLDELDRLAAGRPELEIFLSVIDLFVQTTTVIAAHPATRERLAGSMGLEFIGNTACVPRILLRKTDFVPALISVTG